jgi:hypothetical protein
LSGSWGPRWDHTLCALVNDLRVGARHARPPVGHILPATCGNALPPFSGVKWSQVQIAALAAVGLRLADPIPQRLGQTFNCSASRRITGVGSDSRYNRTARSGNSTGYLLFAASKTSFLGLQDQTWFGSLRKTEEPHTAHSCGVLGTPTTIVSTRLTLFLACQGGKRGTAAFCAARVCATTQQTSIKAARGPRTGTPCADVTESRCDSGVFWPRPLQDRGANFSYSSAR